MAAHEWFEVLKAYTTIVIRVISQFIMVYNHGYPLVVANTVLAGKQQVSFERMIKKSAQYKNQTFPRGTAPKQRNRSTAKSCGDAQKLFPHARPPDTALTS